MGDVSKAGGGELVEQSGSEELPGVAPVLADSVVSPECAGISIIHPFHVHVISDSFSTSNVLQCCRRFGGGKSTIGCRWHEYVSTSLQLT